MKKAILLVLLYFICQFVGTLPFIVWHFIQGTPNPIMLTDGAELGLSVLISDVLIIAHLLFWKDVRFSPRSFIEVSGRVLLLCVPLVLSAMYVLNVLIEWLQLPNWGENAFLSMARNPWGILCIVIGAPLTEELLFRGAVINHLFRKGYSANSAIAWSAIIFGVFHLNPAQMPFACLLGLFLGWLYVRTGSLVPGMLCHFINNTIGVISMQQGNTETISEWMGGETVLWAGFVVALIVFTITFTYARKQLRPTTTREENQYKSPIR